MRDLLVDDGEVSESVYEAALDAATSPQEIAFRDVLVFHRDFLNGGLTQALSNKRDELPQFMSAYRVLGLGWLADLIELAASSALGGVRYKDFETSEIETLDSAYCAAVYGPAYASDLRREIVLEERDETFRPVGDNIERLALRYARLNRQYFDAVLRRATE